MTNTPLSDIISQLRAESNPGSLLYDTFVEAFRRSTVGVVTLTALSNRRPGEIFAAQANEVRVATVLTPDGRNLVKACADPSVFAQRYPDTAIGALVLGEDVLRMVAEPSSNVEGVAVCGAASFHSVPITRAEAISRIATPLSARAPTGDGTFVVPPGHQVRIVFPQVEPSFGQLACGV